MFLVVSNTKNKIYKVVVVNKNEKIIFNLIIMKQKINWLLWISFIIAVVGIAFLLWLSFKNGFNLDNMRKFYGK